MPSNLTATDKRQSVAWNKGPQVATWTIDFDGSDFVNSSGQRVAYASGDVVRLTNPIPTGKAMCVLSVSTYQDTAATAATSALLDIGFDGGNTLVNDYSMKTTAATKTNTALGAPVFGDAAAYLTLTNTITGSGTKGKVTVTVVYCLV